MKQTEKEQQEAFDELKLAELEKKEVWEHMT